MKDSEVLCGNRTSKDNNFKVTFTKEKLTLSLIHHVMQAYREWKYNSMNS